MPVQSGHMAGFETLLHLLEFCLKFGVKQVTVYAFSQDNFSRPKEEVDSLMLLALEKFEDFVKHESMVMRERVRVRVVCTNPGLLSKELRLACHRVESSTAENSGALLNICFSYSGAAELSQAVYLISQAVATGEISAADVSETLISRVTALSTGAPDLVVRTSGESRLSDFLLWHVSASQIFVLSVLWPDISIFIVWCVLVVSFKRRVVGCSSSLLVPSQSDRAEAFVQRVHTQRLNAWLQ